tara:strand:+ start:13 stop:801 length:789 start_codon:yes stop_codon:yes gene_type:complete
MEKYPKLFIKASIFYLVLGSLMGVVMGTQLIISSGFRFVHIHVNLVGFMAMMIMGISYHILPRFNGRPLRYPDWVPVQFYLTNIGLAGMLTFYLLGGYWEPGIRSFMLGLFAVLTATSILMFAINIISVLEEPKPVMTSTPAATQTNDDEKKIPSSIPVSTPTSQPAVKIPQAPPFPAAAGIGTGKGIKKGEICNGEVMIGKLLETYPETKKVFAKHYGESCFTCPGQAYETVDQTASMHNMDVNVILKDINNEIEKALKVN